MKIEEINLLFSQKYKLMEDVNMNTNHAIWIKLDDESTMGWCKVDLTISK